MTITDLEMPTPTRPGPAAWWQLILAESRSVIRDTAGLIVPIGMPSLLIVTQGASYADEHVPGTGGRSIFEFSVLPLMLVMVVALVGVVNMPSFLAHYRHSGILKRLATTPAHPSMVLVAQVVTSLVQTLIGVAIAIGISAALFGLVGPANLPATITVFALVCAAMYALGMIVAAISPTPNAAVAIGLVLFFGIAAVGGLFGGPANLPDAVAELGRWLPYGAGFDALHHAWLGETVPWKPIAALAGFTAVGTACAARFFRWTR